MSAEPPPPYDGKTPKGCSDCYTAAKTAGPPPRYYPETPETCSKCRFGRMKPEHVSAGQFDSELEAVVEFWSREYGKLIEESNEVTEKYEVLEDEIRRRKRLPFWSKQRMSEDERHEKEDKIKEYKERTWELDALRDWPMGMMRAVKIRKSVLAETRRRKVKREVGEGSSRRWNR